MIFLALVAIVFFNISKDDASHKKIKLEFHDGLALVPCNDGTQVFLDSAGNEKFIHYRFALPFCGGRALVMLDGGKLFLIDTLGNKTSEDYALMVFPGNREIPVLAVDFSGKNGGIVKTEVIKRTSGWK